MRTSNPLDYEGLGWEFRIEHMVWHHPLMRLLLPILVILQLLPPGPAALGQDQSDVTVRLLVNSEVSELGVMGRSLPAPVGEWQRVEVPLEGTPEATASALENELGTEVVVERSYPLLGPADEPGFSQQWALENTGQNGGVPDADIDASQAWSRGTGNGVVVAVIDSGVDSAHPELDSRIWSNPGETINGVDDDGNGYIDDMVGWDFVPAPMGDNDPRPVGSGTDDIHGTAVAGVIAAEANGIGIVGVAPAARIMNLRACDDGSCWSLDASAAIYYAVAEGARVINLSFGGPSPSNEGDPALEAAMGYARSRDVMVITAAGNTAPDGVPDGQIIVPAELPGSNNLAVAASDRNDRLAAFSFYSSRIDIAAPGVDIRTTVPSGYATFDGTSFSAPFVSGAAAVLLSIYPGMTHHQLAARLIQFTDEPSHVVARVPGGRLNLGRSATHRFADAVGHLFEAEIEWAALHGITRGCDPPLNILFCPDDLVRRDVMAAFLVRAFELPATNQDYYDDDNGSIFEDDINRLARAGITQGCAERRYCPAALVSRGQMAAFLVRSLGLAVGSGSDLFRDDDGSIFERDIDKLAVAGITKGCNPPANDRFCPESSVTRGAMAAFLERAERGWVSPFQDRHS